MITFDDGFRTRLIELFTWRRDVRRFRPDPLPPQTLERLIHIACLSPSVGLSQPWRFVMVDDPARRRAIAEVFEACNAEALSSYPRGLGDRYASLKLAGIKEAPAQLTVFADRGTRVGHGLGRRTMPEMIEYSVVAAVHTIWLAARAEGIGLGWISILERRALSGHGVRPVDLPGEPARHRNLLVGAGLETLFHGLPRTGAALNAGRCQ